MNERIKELADRILPNEKEFHQGDPKDWGYFFSVDELEKFAELIVQECIKELENDTRCRIAGADKIVAKHFGVEE